MMSPETDTDKLHRRNRELSILNTIAEALNHEVELSQSLETTLAKVTELFDLQTGWIWLLREETGQPYLAVAHNLPPALANTPRRMEGSCYCLDTYQEGEMSGASNVSVIACSRLKGLGGGTDGLRYHASIPLYAHGKPLGILNVVSADWRELSPDDLRLLYTVGDLLSIAIERTRLFAKSMEAGAAEERNRLAREIHDTLAQGLAAIALQLETADALLDSGASTDRAQKAVHQALSLARANLEEARRSVLDLRAAPLEGRTLGDALAVLVREYNTKWNMKIKFHMTGENRSLPIRIESGLYRIAQEALTNVVRHAKARHVNVQFTVAGSSVNLVVQDDGVGFDPALVSRGHYGIIGMNERTRLLGGTLQLESSLGSGTRLAVTVKSS